MRYMRWMKLRGVSLTCTSDLMEITGKCEIEQGAGSSSDGFGLRRRDSSIMRTRTVHTAVPRRMNDDEHVDSEVCSVFV